MNSNLFEHYNVELTVHGVNARINFQLVGSSYLFQVDSVVSDCSQTVYSPLHLVYEYLECKNSGNENILNVTKEVEDSTYMYLYEGWCID